MISKRLKTIAKLPLVIASITMIMFIAATDAVMAAQPVRIWDSEGDEHRRNKVMAVGVSKEATIGYKLDGISEKSHVWKIDNPEICEIDEDVDGNFTITGIAEGLTRLRLEVVGTDKKTYTDYIVVSVYTPVDGASGTTNKSTLATRSAHSGTENKNERSMLPEGTSLSVYGKCGDYYRATVDYPFTDGRTSRNAFVLISDITIPVTGITLDKTSTELRKCERLRLNALIVPAVATDNTVTWKSSDPEIVSVNQNGILSGKKDGEAVIEASVGGKAASCKVNVSGEYKHEALKLSTSKETLAIGKKTKLYAPSGVVDTYTSSNNNIVTVGRDGTVEGIAPGEAQITAVSLYDEKVVCNVTVKYPNAPKVSYKKAKNGKYTLSWKKVSNVSGYQVYKYNSKKGKYKKYKTIKSSKKQKLTVKKGKYKVRSFKKNANGKSFYSAFTFAKLSKQSKAKYKIVYVANGGKGKKYSQTVEFNKRTRIKTNKYKRTGYAFVGWATAPKGEVILKNKNYVKKLTNKEKIKLYAIWRSDKDPNGKVQRRAILYADKSELRFSQDIYQMKKVYENANFDGRNIKTALFSEKRPNEIKSIIKKTGKDTTKNDVTYLHFSCHGSAQTTAEGELEGIGDLCVTKDTQLTPEDLRIWLDEYIDGTVVITLAQCYSGKFQKRMVALDNAKNPDFITRFTAAGTGPVSAAKYKILTASGDGESLGTIYGLNDCVLYWSKGLGFDSDGNHITAYADTSETDNEGYRGYGNYDGKVTLNELYNYAKPPIYNEIIKYGHLTSVPYVLNTPRVYPVNDDFVIYKR